MFLGEVVLELSKIIVYALFLITSFSIFFAVITVQKHDKKKGFFNLFIFFGCILSAKGLQYFFHSDIVKGVIGICGLLIADALVIFFATKIKKKAKEQKLNNDNTKSSLL